MSPTPGRPGSSPFHAPGGAALAACLAALLALGAGCGSGGGTDSGAGGRAGAGASVLRLPQPVEPTTLDPARVEDGPTIEPLMCVFEGLVQWSSENRLTPALAEKWEVSPDGVTYTFHLREGVKFHNGRPLTAGDFVYSLTRSLSRRIGMPSTIGYLTDIVGARDHWDGKAASVRGIEAPDNRTLRLTIDSPKAYFLAKLTYPTAYAVCREEVEKTGGQVTDASAVGTGPFRLTEYAQGDRMVLEANPGYWAGPPKLARVERLILPDANARHDKFEAGELDIADVPMASVEADRQNSGLGPLLHDLERASVYYLALNQNGFAPFKDRRVRQAFAHAVNREQIVRVIHQGVPRQAEGIIPFGVPGFDPSFRGLAYDPARAKQLLAEAGYPGGSGFPPVTLSCRASMPDIRNTVQAVQADLESNLGIHVELDEVEWNTFLARRSQGRMPFYFLRWAADYLDPQNFLSYMLHSKSGLNTIGYASPEFDRLCDRADGMQDEKERMALYRRAERIAVDDAPWIPVYFQKDVELWNGRLRDVDNCLMGRLPPRRVYFTE
jgi:ABC-type transport system substrate-binding protein